MKKDKKQVILFGGLGNQLFQYFFGLYFEKMEKKKVLFNENISQNFGSNHSNSLSSYLTIEVIPRKSKLHSKIFTIAMRVLMKLQRELKTSVISRIFRVYIAPNLGYLSEKDLDKNSNKFVGYFQTWRYFESIQGKIHFYNQLTPNRSDLYKDLSELVSSDSSIGIHIRRGDYLLLSQEYGILALGYYEKALQLLGGDSSSKIFIFSDNILEAKIFLSELDRNSDWTYVSGIGPLETMLLLGQCRKICISNSTFGYWAAQLGNPEAVVAPKKWFRNLEDPTDLVPTNWIKCPSEWQS